MRDDEDDDWDADDFEDEDDESTVPCPYCKREIFDDAPRCPHCGNYLSAEDAPIQPKSWWIVLGAVAALFGMTAWVWLG